MEQFSSCVWGAEGEECTRRAAATGQQDERGSRWQVRLRARLQQVSGVGRGGAEEARGANSGMRVWGVGVQIVGCGCGGVGRTDCVDLGA
eukprot:365595-Chlamydomonas_euryale.AAC.1